MLQEAHLAGPVNNTKPVWYRLRHWLILSPTVARIALVLALLGAVVGVFSLASAAGNNTAWAQHYNAILWVNIAIIVMLLGLVLILLLRLLWRLKKSRFGARLTLQFAGAFALIGFFPGILVYLISVLFLSQSVDSWFNVKVDSALEAGLELSRTAINTQLQVLSQKARSAANSVDTTAAYGSEAQRIRTQYADKNGDLDVLFFNTGVKLDFKTNTPLSPKVLTSTGSLATKGLLSDTPLGPDLALLKKQGWVSLIEAVPSPDGDAARESLILRAVVALSGNNTSSKDPAGMGSTTDTSNVATYIQLSQPVSAKITQLSQTVAQGSKDYETLLLGRSGLRKIYGASLTITLLLAVLAAVAAGFVVADAMSAPLLRLARGTQAVAAGDFSPLPQPVGKDDLAVLTRSFNRMLAELSSARGALTQSNTFLNEVLTQLSTGVLVLDAQRALRSINPSAQSILGLSRVNLHTPAQDQIPSAVWSALTLQSSTLAWQMQIEHPLPSGEVQHLLLRGAPLAQIDGVGTLLVFDDVSDVMLAQKSQAWSEVARRLAHEIKNPLTPIQLSAERLAMKLGDKLTGTDADLLKRSIATIVAQVSALKTMVDEFRQYARLPQAHLAPHSLHDVLSEVLMLYKGKVRVQFDATNDGVMIDTAQITQVLHNLLGNALDAAASRHPDSAQDRDVVVLTQDSDQGTVLRIRDNGTGFSVEAMNKLFEPYHTTKSQGTGLGLAIVHRIVQDHKASIRVKNWMDESNAQVQGAQVTIVFQRVIPSSEDKQGLIF